MCTDNPTFFLTVSINLLYKYAIIIIWTHVFTLKPDPELQFIRNSKMFVKICWASSGVGLWILGGDIYL